MIVSLKNNRNLKRNRNVFRNDEPKNILSRNHQLFFKKIPKEELEKIRQENREHYRKYKIKRQRINIIISIIILIPSIWVFSNFIMESKRKEKQNIAEWEAAQRKKDNEKEEKIRYFLNIGYKWLSEKNYKNAKIQFYKAYELNNKSFLIDLANSKAYVYDCIENNVGCDPAAELMESLNNKYDEKVEVNELTDLFLNRENR